MPSTCSESQNLLRRFFSFSHFGAQRIWKERGSEGSMFLLLFLKKKKKKGKYKREWGRIGGKIMCATLAVSSQSGLEQLSFSYNPSLDFFYSPHFQKKISPVATVSLDLNFDGDDLSLSSQSHHICVWSSFIRSAHLKWSQPSLQKPTKIIIIF